MKRVLKIGVVLLLLVGVALAVLLYAYPDSYKFLIKLVPKDDGVVNLYYYCENGVYYTYPYQLYDGSSTYYDKNGKKIGECHSFIEGDTCAYAEKLAGECSEQGLTTPPAGNAWTISNFVSSLFR